MRSESGRAAAEVGKGIALSAVFTLAMVLVFALFIKLFSVGSSVILPVNQVIKVVSIFLGCFLCIRPGKSAVKGAICGLGTVIVTYFLFAIIAGEISFGWGNVLDLAFGALAGLISGAICALAKGRQ
ncbi:MAG TPA: TIGR04086 family membrane protein [Candidatus Borkfalkia excrementigallinarum]|uniref:TIGR04086 family membrane protein n=1 Tax=Candidatus Borkfalkia excrementigallinarum TaxID=2838506 RepID=A0A9D1ZW67_9FIRM|nr:TIGR04086 family membrane protein [Candidatus Borkfalkia excrementigallinarum]